MSDGKTFIRSLAKCDPSQVVPLLRSGGKEHWMALKQLCDGVASGKVPMKGGKLPRHARRWFNGVVNNRYADDDPDMMIKSIKRASLQRGGSKAQLVGDAVKLLAKIAVPHLKKAGGALAKKAAATAISTGVAVATNKLKSKPSSPKDQDEDDDIDPNATKPLDAKEEEEFRKLLGS